MSTVTLRRLQPPDLSDLYDVVTEPAAWCRSRFRTRPVVPPAGFGPLVHGGAADNIVACDADGEALAWFSVVRLDERNGTAVLAPVVRPGVDERPRVEAVARCLDHVFAQLPVRKVYLEVLPGQPDVGPSALHPVAELEGVLTAYDFVDGAFVDLAIWSVGRRAWVGPVLAPPPEPALLGERAFWTVVRRTVDAVGQDPRPRDDGPVVVPPWLSWRISQNLSTSTGLPVDVDLTRPTPPDDTYRDYLRQAVQIP